MEISQHWRLKKERYNLVGAKCPKCGHKSFPPREVCPRCATQTTAVETVTIEKKHVARAKVAA